MNCDLCTAETNLSTYEVEPKIDDHENTIEICEKCLTEVDGSSELDVNHWRCLSGSMWSEKAAVQVASWRMLKKLNSEGWAQDLFDQMYLADDVQAWASALESDTSNDIVIKDSNGARLLEGDSVTLIKDLVVKGANFTAKRGTLVKNISLTNNPKHIEGKVSGTQIVLVAAFLKKVT